MLFVDIVAPDGAVFRGEATGVQAPGVEGSFEVRTGHAPMIAAFGVGPLTIRQPSGDAVTYATSGGFLEVLHDRVTVLAETAEPASSIDTERAKQAEDAARERLKGLTDPSERAAAEAALERARNRLRAS
ncbi:MAG: ATP synthase F1 subunit epsilon, partial [Rhodothermales bacterium]|nr:ATP synthase F1 subunit epsilon [Rhodothermales bacterium]